MVHVGQTEDIAGQGAGKQFKAAGAKKVLVVIHEASNSGAAAARGRRQEDPRRRRREGADDPEREVRHPRDEGEGARLRSRRTRSLDGFLGLDPDVTIPCLDVCRRGRRPARSTSADAIKEIQAGRMLFAIDQQQYLQGYLPVVFAMLYVTNLNTVGNGAPVLTGPGIINKANAAQVAALAKQGTR